MLLERRQVVQAFDNQIDTEYPGYIKYTNTTFGS
jgi:hypothetical protein